MTAEQLMIGIKKFLEMHPECRDWELYDTSEQSPNYSLAFVPSTLKPVKINDYAKINKWEEQEWFYDANGTEPSEDLREKWQKTELEEKLVKHLSGICSASPFAKRYYDESSFDEEVVEEDVKCGDEIVDFSKLLHGNVGILIKLRIATKWGEENFGTFLQTETLWGICRAAISNYVDCQASNFTVSAIANRIRQECDAQLGGTLLSTAEFDGIETINLPAEFGNGVIFVATFEV